MAEQETPQVPEVTEVQAIRIDVDGRYLVVLTTIHEISPAQLNRVHDTLKRWWKSEEKFLMLGVRPEASIRLERVDAPE